MTSRRKFTTMAMATAAAALFSTAPITAVQASSDANIHCFGVNKCKGHSACKGHGFVTMSKHACEEIGGSVGKPKK